VYTESNDLLTSTIYIHFESVIQNIVHQVLFILIALKTNVYTCT